ncbi:MAG: hypothetical protein IJT97_05940, partial [Bacteroidaceae bacterium]|nr:hypothetical protein [Bacteroidaceae bacterium]
MRLPSLFNPSNDMALAANLRQYSPPKRIQQMEADLAALAGLWPEGPWGWSLATKRRYLQMGVSAERLPSDEWIAEVRRLSSRQFACEYLHGLLCELDDGRLLGKDMTFHTELGRTGVGAVIYKSPWSSSGRGVFTSVNLTEEQVRTRLQGFLHTQGGYVSDRFYMDKTLDFAMEFWVHPDHRVEFLGYSVFHTEANGAYAYNLVDSQEQLCALIDVDRTLLTRLIDYHKSHLGQRPYHGPVGIDMLKTPCALHPVVEINFRMNMGILALLLYKKYG